MQLAVVGLTKANVAFAVIVSPQVVVYTTGLESSLFTLLADRTRRITRSRSARTYQRTCCVPELSRIYDYSSS